MTATKDAAPEGGADQYPAQNSSRRFTSRGTIRTRIPNEKLDPIAERLGGDYQPEVSLRTPCPAHGGSKPNLSVRAGENGYLLVRCWSRECDWHEIIRALMDVLDGEPSATVKIVRIEGQEITLPTEEQLEVFEAQMRESESRDRDEMLDCCGWSDDRDALSDMGVGFANFDQLTALGVNRYSARNCLVFPQCEPDGEIVGVLRYRPTEPKRYRQRAIGPRGLFLPYGRMPDGPLVFLTEGESDTVTAALAGLPAVGVPGANNWRDRWSAAFVGRVVVLAFDPDDAGREGAETVLRSLRRAGVIATVIDIGELA